MITIINSHPKCKSPRFLLMLQPYRYNRFHLMCFINSTNGWVQSASMDIYKTITRKREETQVKGVMHARTPGKKASLDVLYSPLTVTVSRHHPHRGNLRHKWRVRTHPLQWEGINLLCIYRRLLKELHSLWIRLNVSEESLDEDYKIIFNLKRL